MAATTLVHLCCRLLSACLLQWVAACSLTVYHKPRPTKFAMVCLSCMLWCVRVYVCVCVCICLQATLSGLLTAGMFYFISAAKPLEELSATRPHPSIFCAYFFTSLLGQFAMHLTFLIIMYRWGGQPGRQQGLGVLVCGVCGCAGGKGSDCRCAWALGQGTAVRMQFLGTKCVHPWSL